MEDLGYALFDLSVARSFRKGSFPCHLPNEKIIQPYFFFLPRYFPHVSGRDHSECVYKFVDIKFKSLSYIVACTSLMDIIHFKEKRRKFPPSRAVLGGWYLGIRKLAWNCSKIDERFASSRWSSPPLHKLHDAVCREDGSGNASIRSQMHVSSSNYCIIYTCILCVRTCIPFDTMVSAVLRAHSFSMIK